MIATVSKVGATDKFTLLDDFGVIPFLLFSLAPILYPNRKERSRLVAVLVVTGWYLAVTAFLEGVGLKNLVWPTYINDPNIGIHFDRARGPFVEATINGLGLIGGATAGLIGLQIWRQRAARWAAGLLIPASLLGAVLTLTRSVWIAGAAFTAVAIIGHPRTRKFAFPIAIATFVGVLLAFALVPGLTSNAEARASDQRPVWDRLNNNRAAVAAFEDNPLFGVGWQRMQETSYALQADTYPLTGGKVRVHNVFLSNLAELGLVGFVPWLAAFILGVVVSAVRRVPPTLRPWRQGLQCYLLAWLAVAMFAPLAGPFPNSLLWLLAGIVASPYTSSPPALARVEPAEAVR
jgi:O-antigen ligase